MITGFLVCCRPFIWFLIVAFTICSIPHFELLPEELAGMLGREAYAAQTPSENSGQKSFEANYTYDYSGKILELTYPTGHTPKTKKVIDVTSPMFLAGATLTGVGVGVFLVGLVIIIPTLIAMFKVLAATNFVSKGVPFIKAIFITGLISMPISSIMFMAGIPTLAVSIAKSPDVEEQAEPFLLQDIARNVLWQGIVKLHILG